MACFEFYNYYDKFKDFYMALEKEPEIVKLLIKCSDKILSTMTAQQMIYSASDCFNKTEECMFNYLKAQEHAQNLIVKEYCKLKYKEALDARNVISKYLPATQVKIGKNDSYETLRKKLIDHLFRESKSEKYHQDDFFY